MSGCDDTENFLKHFTELKDEKSNISFSLEFDQLRELSQLYKEKETYPSVEGQQQYNLEKNRYKDILPFDHSRVKLQPIPDQQGSDYINANYIQSALAGHSNIAAQGPLPKTLVDFYRMIWQHRVDVIAMACKEYEGMRLRCKKYWPEDEPLQVDEFVLTTINCEDYGDYTLRRFTIRHAEETRQVSQLHYLSWPDHGTPECVDSLLDMIDKMNQLHQNNPDGPILIHCSAGCGRTGTILVIDYIWNLIKAKKYQDISVFEVVKEMRKQRMAIVQSPDQYKFVYEAIARIISKGKPVSLNIVQIGKATKPRPPRPQSEGPINTEPRSSPVDNKPSVARRPAQGYGRSVSSTAYENYDVKDQRNMPSNQQLEKRQPTEVDRSDDTPIILYNDQDVSFPNVVSVTFHSLSCIPGTNKIHL